MKSLELLSLLLMFFLGSISSFSDIKKGTIPNQWIVLFTVIGFLIDLIYYGAIATDTVGLFLANVSVTVLISLLCYFSLSLAGGDVKLILVLSMLYPAGMYLTLGSMKVTLFVAICLAALYGYCYLLVLSLWKIISGKIRIKRHKVIPYVLNYMKSFLSALIYVALINLIFVLINHFVLKLPQGILWISCVVITWMIGKFSMLRKKGVLLIIVLADILLSVRLAVVPVSIYPKTYLFSAIIILCRMIARTDLYETISVDCVREGMILSVFSSMKLIGSKIEGLPGVSNENLGSRLTEEEAESVRRWGRSAKGRESIVIVKKIPFAIFIFWGYISYFAIWSMVS